MLTPELIFNLQKTMSFNKDEGVKLISAMLVDVSGCGGRFVVGTPIVTLGTMFDENSDKKTKWAATALIPQSTGLNSCYQVLISPEKLIPITESFINDLKIKEVESFDLEKFQNNDIQKYVYDNGGLSLVIKSNAGREEFSGYIEPMFKTYKHSIITEMKKNFDSVRRDDNMMMILTFMDLRQSVPVFSRSVDGMCVHMQFIMENMTEEYGKLVWCLKSSIIFTNTYRGVIEIDGVGIYRGKTFVYDNTMKSYYDKALLFKNKEEELLRKKREAADNRMAESFCTAEMGFIDDEFYS